MGSRPEKKKKKNMQTGGIRRNDRCAVRKYVMQELETHLLYQKL